MSNSEQHISSNQDAVNSAISPAEHEQPTAQLRRQAVLEIILEKRDVSVSELCTLLSTSPHSIRRDLRALEAQGLIERSYGRAMAVPGSTWELVLHERKKYLTKTYAKIAEAAAEELHDAQTIFVDEGNLPGMVVPKLPTTKQLTMITASLRTALAVSENSSHEVVVVGGKIRKRTLASVGYWAREMLDGLTIDLAFMGANGVSLSKGLTTPDERVAQIKRQALLSSHRNVLVCPGERFGLAQFVRFGAISDINMFVTDATIGERQRERMERAGAALKVAS